MSKDSLISQYSYLSEKPQEIKNSNKSKKYFDFKYFLNKRKF